MKDLRERESLAPPRGSVRRRLSPGDFAIVSVASVAGIGFLPGAPATYASFALAALLWVWGGPPSTERLWFVSGSIALISLAGVWLAGRAERIYGHDPHCVVIDEIAGMLTTVLLIPWDLLHLGAAFLLFRAADVLKPPPAYQLQSLPGGWGIVVDDLAAGVYGLILLLLAGAVFPGF
ncbi:MAG: phosphatidylglycerophosphatase A [Candidatus Eisenbacteria bacterium]